MIIKAIHTTNTLKVKEVVKNLSYKCISHNKSQAIFKLKGKYKYIIYYNFGVFTLINVNDNAEVEEFQEYLKLKFEICESRIEDHYAIKIQPKRCITIKDGYVSIPSKHLKYLKLISLVVAESVALDNYEHLTDKMLTNSISYSQQLELKGTYPSNIKKLLKFIGFAINTRQYIISKLHIFNAPDDIWDDDELQNLFNKLQSEFEIEERFKELNISLQSIQQSIEIIVNLMQAKKSHHLEWLIIILIAAEIAITLIEKYQLIFNL